MFVCNMPSLCQKEIFDIRITSLNTYSVNAYYELLSTKSIKKLTFGVPIHWFVDFMEDEPKGQVGSVNQGPTGKILAEIKAISERINISINNSKISNTPVLDRYLFG